MPARRHLALFALTLGLAAPLAACGGDDESSQNSVVSDGELVPVTEPTGEGEAGATPDTTAAPETATPDSPTKPSVEVPSTSPSELVVTDLVEGEGPEAAPGDTVIVDYVGVRTADGEEFDNSYDRGVPFDIVLGSGGVIAGWDEGLVGAQAGGRRQLDIPAELAYGDNAPPGSGIQAGDALTFVIDVRAVVKAADPADAPLDLEIEPSVGATEVTAVDLVEGDGAVLEPGMTGIVHMLLVRGDNEVVLFNTWDAEPFQIVMIEGGSLPGLLEGLEGMQVGGRRIINMPPEDAFGSEGNTQLGLPGDTDLIVVAELVGVY